MTDPTPTPRWYRLTRDRFVIGLLVVECVLWFSERFQWFGFNRQKGSMCRFSRIVPGCLVSLCVTVLVGWALWRAQNPGVLVEAGPLTYPPTFDDTTKHGWPIFWVLRNRYGETFVPGSTKVDYSVLPFNLAFDIAAWFAVVIATAYISWRITFCRGQFTLRFLFSVTTVVAILLAWWKIEYAWCSLGDDSKFTALFVREAETPMLRLLRFPPSIYIPLLLGIGCLILTAIHTLFYVLGLLWNQFAIYRKGPPA